MARRRYAFDEDRITLFHKEGRGTGRGGDYKPWLTVQDVPSSGRVHRVRGLKTGRQHHLLSDIEWRHFLLFDWADDTEDIREQFPLDRALTQQIAEDLGIRHPLDPTTKVPLVMTSDLGSVDIHRIAKTVATRWIAAAKLVSVLSYRVAMRRKALILQKKFSTR